MCSHFQLCDYSEMGRNEMPDRAVFLVWNIRKSADFELSFIMWLWNATGNMFSSLNKLKSIESNESIFILRMLKTCKSACVILWVSEAKISWVGFFFSCHQESSFIEHLWLFIWTFDFIVASFPVPQLFFEECSWKQHQLKSENIWFTRKPKRLNYRAPRLTITFEKSEESSLIHEQKIFKYTCRGHTKAN